MTDIALQDISAPGEPARFDIAFAGADLATDDGLQTAVILSLFCDRRAEADDVLPDASGDRRGWWADAWPDVAGDLWGSRGWLLERAKELPEVERRAEAYAEQALAWLIADGVASAVRASAQRLRRGVLALRIVIERSEEGYAAAWEQTFRMAA